jgi:nitrogen regulatory protein P-II 1
MKEIKAVIQPSVLDAVINALKQIPDLPGVTVSEVKGFGRSRAADSPDSVWMGANVYAKKIKLEIVVPDELLDRTLHVIVENAHRGTPGDGKIFVSTIDDVIKVRSGEHGNDAI